MLRWLLIPSSGVARGCHEVRRWGAGTFPFPRANDKNRDVGVSLGGLSAEFLEDAGAVAVAFQGDAASLEQGQPRVAEGGVLCDH